MKKEMRNPHPFELLLSEYFNHSIMDSKLSWKQEICLRVESEQSDGERKNALTRSCTFKDKGELFYVQSQLSR